MSPRSILKHSSASFMHPNAPSLDTALPYPPPSPQVHFPPTPSLAQTYPTHSVSAYDRAPIVVAPNDCALPERGCPGRTYAANRNPRSGDSSGKHPHPRATEESATGRIPPHASGSSPVVISNRGPPPLVPDVSSSESDESDGIVSPPPEYSSAGAAAAGKPYPYACAHAVSIASPSQEQLDKALAFLPYAPTSPPSKDAQKRDKERKRRTGGASRDSKTLRFKSEDASRSFAASSLDGCLGGF
ncbi:hypothetical protein DFH11DRAFT_9059 [Phellopilus nigrolimitatus]|nr:hypothetical protein DFH11DRAFT_9059 [Phellopilus nigrolimitatus]